MEEGQLERLGVYSALCLCCHVSMWYQHIVGTSRILPVYFCTCLSAVSFSVSVPCSLSPSVVKSMSTYLSLSSPSCWVAAQREGAGQLTFPAPLYNKAHIQKDMSYLSGFPSVCEKCGNLRGEECVLPGPLEWPPGICVFRGTDQPLTESHTTTGTAHSSTKMPWWLTGFLRCRNWLEQVVHSLLES